MKCPVCNGSGRHHYYRNVVCARCKGKGELPDDRINNPICPPCRGTGRHHYYANALCPVCGGWGRLRTPFREVLKSGGRAPIALLKYGYERIYNLANTITRKPKVTVTMIEAGKPRTAHLKLEKMLSDLRGSVQICDPYYGTGTLLRLELLANCNEVRFLTHTPDTGERAILPRAISEFKKEYPQMQFRNSEAGDFHDRFVISESEIILIGQGLKDLGNKESFVIRLPNSIAHDVITSARENFERKWQSATLL